MSKSGDEEDEDEYFYESLDRLQSSTASSCSSSSSSGGEEEDPNYSSGSPNYAQARRLSVPKFPMGLSNNYDIWISEPASINERRVRLLHRMGLSRDPTLNRSVDAQVKVSCSDSIVRSKSDSYSSPRNSREIYSINSVPSTPDIVNSFSVVNPRSGNGSPVINSVLTNKPPSGKYLKPDSTRSVPTAVDCNSSEIRHDVSDCNEIVSVSDSVCTIKNLDDGKEFVVNEVRGDGSWNKLKEVATGRQLTMEEFEMCVGHSPIVQELMRRQSVEDSNKDNVHDLNTNSGGGGGGGGSKLKKKKSWLKSIKSVASSVKGHKDRRSSDEKDTSSEKGGRRSSSATDDSQDVSFHGPERIRVRQYGKSYKELSAVYKSQEIQAHNGSIWTMKFSLDGKYLASAGEDCVIHVWQVVESERKGDLLLDNKNEDGNLSLLLLANGSPEPGSISPNLDSQFDKKRRGRSSISRKSVSLDRVVVPETIFSLSDKPFCSFEGHLDDVLDLSWSKSQHLLSSSMDKTVRLWQLSNNSCLKIFSHSDYVTCIQFNPVDDSYFISGSLDGKVRIWSIPDRQVVDWNDLHEMVTAACYTPDAQAALVGSYKGSCRLYNISESKMQPKSHINLQNKKKKSHHKKITGFQFAPGSSSEVLITSADSRIRVVDGVDLIHKFKGFRNTNSQISANLTSNGRYVVSASEDNHVYIWKHEGDSRPSRSKGVTITRSYEHFHCQDVSTAIPWPGFSWEFQDAFSREPNSLADHLDDVSTANHPPTPVEYIINNNGENLISPLCNNSPLHGTISSATNSYFFDRISATWPEEKLVLAAKNRSPHPSVDFSNAINQRKSAWGMVIVAAGLRGKIRTFQNFGLPVRI
jgi:WD40 repeat protein